MGISAPMTSQRKVHRNNAILAARMMVDSNAFVLDTETTGPHPEADVACSVSIVRIDGTLILDTYVKPSIPIPSGATSVHHITNEMVASCRLFRDVWNNIVLQYLAPKDIIVTYNARFDRLIILNSYGPPSNDFVPGVGAWKCAMLTYSAFNGAWNASYGNYRWWKLSEACTIEGIPIPEGLHNSLVDVKLTIELVKHMARSFEATNEKA